MRFALHLLLGVLYFEGFRGEAVDLPLTFLTENDFLWQSHEQEEFLTEGDFRNGELLTNYSQGSSMPILYQQAFLHGDIRGKASWKLKTRRKGARRNGVISGVKKWPGGRIPYVISTQYTERERAILARSFQEYHRRTCIRFVPRSPVDRDYLYIGKIDGCYSDVGRAGGRQELSLDDGCLQYDTAIHELMHSVGFYHEHERWDRDNYITILWQNIDRDAYEQFGKVDLSESSYYGQTYDYFSIMHYDSLAFSKNGFETMVAKRPGMTAVIGSAIDFSPVDVLKMNLMYQCERRISAPEDLPSPVPMPAPVLPPIDDEECDKLPQHLIRKYHVTTRQIDDVIWTDNTNQPANFDVVVLSIQCQRGMTYDENHFSTKCYAPSTGVVYFYCTDAMRLSNFGEAVTTRQICAGVGWSGAIQCFSRRL